jgi:hypothetical protein
MTSDVALLRAGNVGAAGKLPHNILHTANAVGTDKLVPAR